MKWSLSDIDRIKKRGLKVNQLSKDFKVKKYKVSAEKNHIDTVLHVLVKDGKLQSYEKEYRFDKARKFRFDWYIPELKLGIEYEGLISEKSRHTTIKGYTKDTEKYNLAMKLGYRFLRYTALNYEDIFNDILKLI